MLMLVKKKKKGKEKSYFLNSIISNTFFHSELSLFTSDISNYFRYWEIVSPDCLFH